MRALRALFLAFSLISVAFYAVRFGEVFAARELFHRLGFDWSLFYAQALAVRAGAGPGMYDLNELTLQILTLQRYYAGSATPLSALPLPYPPWVAAAFVPLTFLPAPIAFALWLAMSVIAAVFLGYRVWQFLPDLGRVGAVAAVLAAVPVAWALFLGQITVLLAVAVSEMFVSFKARRDFTAGLWLSVLLFKPQYAVLFGLLILFKLRWRAIAGAIVGAFALTVSALLVAGVPAMLRFPTALGDLGELRNELARPYVMMNWRAIVLTVQPRIDEQLGLVLVAGLSVLTALACLLLFRHRWDPAEPSFDTRFCVLTLGALFTSYHTYLHGAPLLIVPLAAAWAGPILGSASRVVLWLAMYSAGFWVLWTTGVVERMVVSPDPNIPLWTVWPDSLPAVLFLLGFALLYADLSGIRVPLKLMSASARTA